MVEESKMEYTQAKIKDILVEFLKMFRDEYGELKYRTLISQLPAKGAKSVAVDFQNLLAYNTEIATNLIREPDMYLKEFDGAALEALAIEDPVYSEHVKKEMHVRIRELTDPLSLRDVTKTNLNTLIMVKGMVVRTSELRPLVVRAAFRCSEGHTTFEEQAGTTGPLKRPMRCSVEGCGESKNFEFDEIKSEFIDFQIFRIQELPEELPPGQLPQTFEVHLFGDLVNTARPGDRIVLVGIVKAESEYSQGSGKLKLFTYRIEGNFVEQVGKSPEETEISREEEEEIKSLAAMPAAYDRLINSVAPAIYGHEIHKEAALLLMVGAKQKSLPDGSMLRGDINVLLVGDPGCLVYDERVVLGNGAITKIGRMGTRHLQPLTTQILVAGSRRAEATRFHAYHSQPTIEIITESGKSLKGTHNHPVLVRKKESGSRETEWKRLDELKVGDKVCVVTRIPCTVTKLQDTNFNPYARKNNLGPSFKGKLPALVTRDLAALLGYMLGDCRVRKTGEQSGFVVSDTDKDILPVLLAFCRSTFGIEPHLLTKTDSGRTIPLHYALIQSKDIATNLPFLQEKRVPEIILQSGNEVVSSFLRWLYEADGCVFPLKRGTGTVALKAKNIELLRDIQLLLLRFGIHSRINNNALIIRRTFSILKFQRWIGFASIRKRAVLAKVAEIAKAKPRVFHGQMIERIVKILHGDFEDVFDIEVPDGHRFIANGIITHNTAKSELLKYVSRVAPRALYTSGRGTTAAGLTAAVVKERNGMMMLEAGATVLADQGVAVIDEFDKMRKEDRDALHEVMEQQSYHPTFEISLADGRRRPIGDYVEGLLSENKSDIVVGKDCEILPLSEGPLLYSCDISTGGIKKIKVDRVSRHKSPDSFVAIRYSNGRKVTVTPEHPIFVYRANSITTIPASELSTSDYVPIPKLVPNSLEPVLLSAGSQLSLNGKVTLPETLTQDLSRVLGFLVSEGHSYAGSSYEIGFTNSDDALLSEVKGLFARIFGIHPSIQSKDGVTTQRYISKTLFGWFVNNFDEIMRHAREKRVPQKVLASSVHVIREFLSAAFLGDGSVESSSICYRTASQGLAEDYQDLLHKLGIMSRIFYDRWSDSFKVYIMGDSIPIFFEKIVERFDKLREFQRRIASVQREDDTFPPQLAHEITLLLRALGEKGSNYFYIPIKGNFTVNRSVVQKYVRNIHDAVTRFQEFSDGEWTSLRSARSRLGISQQLLAKACGTRRGVIDYLERGGHKESSEIMLKELRQNMASYIEPLRNKLQKMKSLLEYRFLRVSEVKTLRNEGPLKTDWVYDVTVEPTNNFISKGVILHNTASVAKGGFIATLNARTSILAAANPVFGKYDPYKNILDNVNLPVPLLTRFDLVFIVKDEPDAARDEILAKHVLDMHAKLSFPRAPPVAFDLLKKYIAYAKKLDPELTEEARKRLSDYYVELRRMAQPGQIAVTPRWLEGLIRLSIARARILLRPRVTDDDALRAVNLMKRMLETVAVDQNTKQVDPGVFYGKPLSERSLLETALETFKQLEGTGQSKEAVKDEQFIQALVKTGKFSEDEADKMLKTLYRSGQIYETKPHYYRKI